MSTRRISVCLLVLALFGVGGCFHRHVSRSETGEYVDGRVFEKITPGKTTGGWAKSLLGNPSQVTKTDAGTEIWKWNYSQRKEVDGQLLIFTDKSVVDSQREAMLEVKDGIVINKWFNDRALKSRENLN